MTKYSESTQLAMHCITVVERQVERVALGQAIAKNGLYGSLLKHYDGIVRRTDMSVRDYGIVTGFAENFRVMQKEEQRVLGGILVRLTDQFRQMRLVEYHELEAIIKKFDAY
jgi:hypothetical protein